jgi:hypothetical protein
MVYELLRAMNPRTLDQTDEWLEIVMEQNLSQMVITRDNKIRKASTAIVEVIIKNSKLDKWEKVGY